MMFNFIKYETKTVYREYLLVLLIAVLANVALMTRVGAWDKLIVFTISSCASVGIIITTLIMNIAMFSRDLKKDTKYLLFTLPKSRYSLLGSKLICSTVMMILSSLVGVGFMLYFGSKIMHFNAAGLLNWDLMKYCALAVVSYVSFLVTVYFCILAARMLRRNGKFSGLISLVIFIAYAYVLVRIENVLDYIFPQKIVMGKVLRAASTAKNVKVSVGTTGGSIYIVSSIFEIILIVLLFIVSVKIIDKKLDL